MISDTASGNGYRFHRHYPGLLAPAVVGHFVHITIITFKITAAGYLQDELMKGKGLPAGRLAVEQALRRTSAESSIRATSSMETSPRSIRGEVSFGPGSRGENSPIMPTLPVNRPLSRIKKSKICWKLSRSNSPTTAPCRACGQPVM